MMFPQNLSLTSETYSAFNYSVRVSPLIGSSPFALNPSTRSIGLNTRRGHYIYGAIDRVLAVIFLLMVYYSVHTTLYHDSILMSMKIVLLVVIILQVCNLVAGEVIRNYKEDIVEMLNGLRTYMDYMGRKYVQTEAENEQQMKSEKQIRIIIITMSSLVASLLCVILLIPVFYIKQLWNVYLICLGLDWQEFGMNSSDPMLSGGFGAVLSLYWYIVCAGAIRILVFTQILFLLLAYTFKILKKLRDFEGDPTSASIQNPGNGLDVYVSMKFLVDLTKEYLSGVTVPLYTTTWLGVCSLELYFACASRGPDHERVVSSIMFLWFGCYSSATIYICGYWWDFTEQLLDMYRIYFTKKTLQRSWDGSPATMIAYYRSKRVRSLVPIRIRTGSTYYMDKFSVLEFWLNVIDKTFTLISCFPLH